MRPAPPKNIRPQQKARPKRLGFWASVVCCCPLCVWLGLQAAYPFEAAARLRERNDDTERQMLRIHLQNQRDEKALVEMDTEQGMLDAARKNGWVMPGEQRLRVPQSNAK